MSYVTQRYHCQRVMFSGVASSEWKDSGSIRGLEKGGEYPYTHSPKVSFGTIHARRRYQAMDYDAKTE